MDTPAVPLPQDAREQAILDNLVVVRDKLLLLKQDRTTYIRSQDILPLYEETIARVKELNEIRTETGSREENRRKSGPRLGTMRERDHELMVQTNS